MYQKGWFFTNKKIEPFKKDHAELSLSDAIARQERLEEVYRSLPGKECGVCGSPDCRTFAEDVVDGRADLRNCVYLRFFPEDKDMT